MLTASVRDVAQRAGVSVGTVSNVLNHPEKVSPSAVERVLAAIEELGFVRNDAARRLRIGRSTTIGLIVLDVRNPFFTSLARAAEDEAARNGLSILLGSSDENAVRESTYLDLFEEQRVHGLIISAFGDVEYRLDRLRERGIPTVLVDRARFDGAFSSVAVDGVAGGRLAVQHLLSVGRRRIVFTGGPLTIPQIADRLAGARIAIEREPSATLDVMPVPALTVLDGRRLGEAILELSPSERPDGIFAANDLLAVGLLQAFAMRGRLRIPEDIALIGYDDIDFASAAVVPLSSIRQPTEVIGQTAVRVLLDEADNAIAPRRVVFEPDLVVRASTIGDAA